MRAWGVSQHETRFLLVVIVSLLVDASRACYIEGRVLSVVEDIERARSILAVRMIQAPAGDGPTEYEVLRIFRHEGDIAVGDRVEAPVTPTGLVAHAKRLLLLHHATGYWDLRPGGHLEPFVESVLALPTAAPDDVEAWQERLTFFLPYIDYLDVTVAQAAMQEFAKAPYRAIQQLRPQVDPERMVANLRRRQLTSLRLQTSLTLLAVSGDASHANALEPLVETRRENHLTDSLGPLLATYLELRGPDGVAYVKDRYLLDTNRVWEEIEAALPAVRFHYRESSSRLPELQALELFRTVLERPPLASLVIPDLIVAEDWSSLARVVEIYDGHADEAPWLRPQILDYLRACPLPAAADALARIERESGWGFRRYRAASPTGID